MGEYSVINVDNGRRYVVSADDAKKAIAMVKEYTGATTMKARSLTSLHIEFGKILPMQKEEYKEDKPVDMHAEYSEIIKRKYGLSQADSDELAFAIIEEVGNFSNVDEFLEYYNDNIQLFSSKKKAWKEYSDVYDQDEFNALIKILPSGIAAMI